MQNKDASLNDIELTMPKNLIDRRKKDRSKDALFIFVTFLNIAAWVLLVSALLVFHYARPEFISGVQDYWGIEGRDFWSPEHLNHLLQLLQFCLFTALVTIVLRSRRNRRKTDSVAYNLIIILVITIISLATIYSIV